MSKPSPCPKVLAAVLAVLGVLVVSIGMWILTRNIHWHWSYKSRVEDQVQEMYEERIQALESKVFGDEE